MKQMVIYGAKLKRCFGDILWKVKKIIWWYMMQCETNDLVIFCEKLKRWFGDIWCKVKQMRGLCNCDSLIFGPNDSLAW